MANTETPFHEKVCPDCWEDRPCGCDRLDEQRVAELNAKFRDGRARIVYAPKKKKEGDRHNH